MTSDSTEATVAVFVAFFIVLIAITYIMIFWKLFRKANWPGWYAVLTPLWCYAMGAIAKRPAVGLTAAVASTVYIPTSFIEKYPAFETVTLVAGLIYIIFGLAALSLFIRQYDAGIGKWFLFLFLPFIGVFFVDKVTYKGASDTPVAPTTPANTGDTPSQTPPQPPTNQPTV